MSHAFVLGNDREVRFDARGTRVTMIKRVPERPRAVQSRPTMTIQHTTKGDTTSITISGEFDSRSAARARPALEKIAEQRPRRVVVDLQGVRLIDSSGVAALVALRKQVLAHGGTVELTHVQSQPREVFEAMSLARDFGL